MPFVFRNARDHLAASVKTESLEKSLGVEQSLSRTKTLTIAGLDGTLLSGSAACTAPDSILPLGSRENR